MTSLMLLTNCCLLTADGGWKDEVISYSGTCGTITKQIFRSCTNPRPRFGGENCQGDTNITFTETKPPCPGKQVRRYCLSQVRFVLRKGLLDIVWL